jgi:hypothetical protein
MGTKQIDVACPCCGTLLTVDVLTRQVLRQVGPQERDTPGSARGERWESAQQNVAGRRATGEDKFDRALGEERGKEARLDELFRKAKDKLSGGGTDDR